MTRCEKTIEARKTGIRERLNEYYALRNIPLYLFVRFVDIFRPDIYNSCLFIQCITSLDMTSIFNLSVMPVLLGNGDSVRKFGTIS